MILPRHLPKRGRGELGRIRQPEVKRCDFILANPSVDMKKRLTKGTSLLFAVEVLLWWKFGDGNVSSSLLFAGAGKRAVSPLK